MGVLRVGAGLVARRTVKTHPQAAVRVEVARVVDVTPTMRRVTFHGPGLGDYPVLRDDHYARLLLPRPGQAEPLLPASARWYPELLALDRAERPVLRNYTLRDVRPAECEVDIDFALHAHGGPACGWALAAAPGDVAGLIEQGVIFSPDPSADHLLLVADDTGLPAVHGLLARWTGPVTVVVEVGSPSDEQSLPVPATWLHRSSGASAVADIPRLPVLTTGRGQAWLAGESGMVTGLRRHLVRERGYAKADISFTGYFKRGRAQYSD